MCLFVSVQIIYMDFLRISQIQMVLIINKIRCNIMMLTEIPTLLKIRLNPGIQAAEPKTPSSPTINISSHYRRVASIRDSRANQLLRTSHWTVLRRRGRGRLMPITPSFWIRWFKSWTGSRTKIRASYASQKPSHSPNKAMAINARSRNQRR